MIQGATVHCQQFLLSLPRGHSEHSRATAVPPGKLDLHAGKMGSLAIITVVNDPEKVLLIYEP